MKSNDKQISVFYKYNRKNSRKIFTDSSHHEHKIRKIEDDK